MTNRTLVIIIAVIILAGAGAAGYFYWQQTKPLVVSQPVVENTPAPTPSQTTPNQPANNQPPATKPTPTPMTCERNFDQNQLAKNSKLSIANRQVSINVKDFGTIVVELYDKDAPKTTENFLRLTDSGFYNCLIFHRVAKSFVIQAGDPNGNGTGGLSAFGAKFSDELNPNTPSYKTGYVEGVLAMANSGPNTNGSQFFITLADVSSALTHNYTIFGKVITGMDVVKKIGSVAITPISGPNDGSPITPVVMQSVKITK
jgi:cyclophilin family peptidyl-prolyl cis-trans isomerase